MSRPFKNPNQSQFEIPDSAPPDEVFGDAGEARAHSANDETAEADDAIVDLDWTEEVEGIDRTIEEIRELNASVEEQIAPVTEEDIACEDCDDPAPQTGEAFERDEEEISVVSRAEVAGLAAELPAVETSPGGISLKCRVQPKSESELGQLWGNIFFAVEQTPPKIVIVMGAQRGEGATQIAVGLAMIGAEADRELKIAVVDFNVRNPQIADLLRLRHEPGLTDVLNGQTTLDNALQVVALRNGNQLHVLTGGTVASHPLGLLKSRQSRTLLANLRERFDHVILDVANAQAYPDPQVLGSLVDGAVMVVKAADTPRETVAEAKKRLDMAGVKCLGLVLNQRCDPIPRLLYKIT